MKQGSSKLKRALDFETTTSYTVTLTATDKDDLTDSITVTINVRNLDERPSNNAPVFTEGATATRSVAENLVAGTNIGTARHRNRYRHWQHVVLSTQWFRWCRF